MTSIKITCKAATSIELAKLQPLQGNLKELSVTNFEKLKKSILKHGISFPFFVWQDNGINYVLDGHQRDRVLRKMQKQGYEDLNEHDRLRHDVVMGLLTEKQDPTIRQF
jgi:ParB-like nuclease domain